MLIISFSLLLCGCPKKVENEPEVKTLSYDIHRPEWIYSEGTQNIPLEIAGKKAMSAERCGDSVLYGIYGYGLAEYELNTESWKLTPIDVREVVVSGIGCSDATIYAGISGHGIMEIDRRTGEKHIYVNGTGSEQNRFLGLIYYEGKAWAPTEVGLYVYDVISKSYELIIDTRCMGITLAEGKIILATVERPGRTILEYDALSAKEERRIKIPGEVRVYGAVHYENGILYLLSNNGITLFNTEDASYQFYDGYEYLGKSRIGRIAVYEGYIVCGTDNGILVLDLNETKWTLMGVGSGIPAGMQSSIASVGGYLFLASDTGPFALSRETFKQAMFLAEPHAAVAGEGGNSRGEISRETSSLSKWININERDGLLNNSVYSLIMTRDDVWVGTSISGLNRISLEDYSVKTYMMEGNTEKGLYHPVAELQKYGDSIFHAGYTFYGEFSIEKEDWVKPVRVFSLDKPLDSEGLYVDEDGVVMAVRKEGLRFRKRDSEEWEIIDASYLNTSPFMTDITRVRGTYYISMDAGVQKFNLEKKLFRYLETGLLDIKSLAADGSSLWIGAKERNVPLGPQNTGLYRYNIYSGNLVEYRLLPDMDATHINDIEVDGPLVWVASEQGLFRLNRLTGEWTSYAGLPEIPPGKVTAVSVFADSIAVGTDAGVFIKKIFLFQNNEMRDIYRKAWELEKAGKYQSAEKLYAELEDTVGESMKGYLEFRRADCLYNDGSYQAAKVMYEYLLEENPLLIADLENLFVETYEYDTYVRALLKEEEVIGEDAAQKKYCEIHLRNVPSSLVKVAARMEKDGKLERAQDYWKLIVELPDSLNGIEDAKREARKRITAN